MRGKVYIAIYLFKQLRITPAHAGKRFSLYSRGFTLKDHPRACGEKRFVLLVSPRK